MPRKGLRPRERRGQPSPDAKFNSVMVARLINKINFKGQKSTAERIVYDAMGVIEERAKEDPLALFNKAIENVRPLLEVKPRRVGGATYQVPCEVKPVRGANLAISWILTSARDKTGKPMCERLADELIQAAKKEGAAFKKREDTHKMAESNRAFAHYKW